MTMRNIAEQAFEAGRIAAKYEMDAINKILAVTSPAPAHGAQSGNAPRKRRVTTKATTAPAVAAAPRARRANGPRTKGVKEAIVAMLSSSSNDGIAASDMIAMTGFKPISIHSTLQGLKRGGIASKNGKLWSLAKRQSPVGNGDETSS